MHYIFEKISMPFVYGPLTLEELNSIRVAKSQIPEQDGWYAGTAVEIPHLTHKKLYKWVPPVMEETPPGE